MTTKSTFVTHEIVSYWMRLFFTFVKHFLQHLIQWVESRLSNVIDQNWCLFQAITSPFLHCRYHIGKKLVLYWFLMWHMIPGNWKHRMQTSYVDDWLIQYMGGEGFTNARTVGWNDHKINLCNTWTFCKHWMRFNIVHVLWSIVYTTLLSEEISQNWCFFNHNPSSICRSQQTLNVV